jgi:hypothetical protein
VYQRLGMGLPPLRRKMTGYTPPWTAGRGRLGPSWGATPVAGATNVAPATPWGEEMARLGPIAPAPEGEPASTRWLTHVVPQARWAPAQAFIQYLARQLQRKHGHDRLCWVSRRA